MFFAFYFLGRNKINSWKGLGLGLFKPCGLLGVRGSRILGAGNYTASGSFFLIMFLGNEGNDYDSAICQGCRVHRMFIRKDKNSPLPKCQQLQEVSRSRPTSLAAFFNPKGPRTQITGF